jgi:CHAT domain-containing protein
MALGFGVTQAYPPFEALTAVKSELSAVINGTGMGDGALRGMTFLDSDFTLANLTTYLTTGFSVLHIASHYQFQDPSSGTEDSSFLLLGDGTHLTVKDIKRQLSFNNLDLLTLSACNTATGIASGDGIEVESLGDVAQKMGAMAVLATLWPVNDISTGLLVSDFYKNRYTGGQSKASALQEAQIKLMKNVTDASKGQRGKPLSAIGAIEIPASVPWNGEGFSHPYYWAPFVIMGNWR